MTSEVIGRVNNYFLLTYLYSNDNVVVKCWKLIKNILGHVRLSDSKKFLLKQSKFYWDNKKDRIKTKYLTKQPHTFSVYLNDKILWLIRPNILEKYLVE